MKKDLAVLAVFALLVLLLPMTGLLFAPKDGGTASPDTDAQSTAPQSSAPELSAQEPPLLIWDEALQRVLTVSAHDFVLGAVAAEMPFDWPDEALKAQAVASHSYALALAARGGDAELGGAYFSANPSQRRGYLDGEGMRALWGDAYTENRAHLDALVSAVMNETVLYDDAPALTCYHAMSNGTTETSEAVWGNALPYLISVASPYDTTAEDYTSQLILSPQEIISGLSMSDTGVVTQGDPSTWLGVPETDSAGYVRSITVCGTTLTGPQFRAALGLRSAAFAVTFEKNAGFTITTRGYGHGVGMSQWGARCMALAGKTHAEILTWYFPGTVLDSGT